MSDFKARIIAELDTSQVEQKISELDGKKVKFGVDSGNAQKDVEKVDNSIKSATKSTKTFGDTLKTSAKLGAAYSITSQTFQAIREAASAAKEAVQEFDAAVMDLRMATGGTYTEVSNLVKEYNELGQAIGATTKEISSGADSWLRQGHSISDTNILIKDSMILSKVAELESAEATQYLTSAMKGYKVEVEDVISIVDKLTAVDLVSATEAGGLAEAMSRTAASADIAGVSMDKLLGYLAATGEVTQKSMTSIGESYKTIFTRMGDIKSGKLQFIDEDGTAESLSDVETVLNNLGIKLRDSNNEFRNFGDVLDEVGASWDDYSTVQKAAISKAFAGTRQSENFKVLMENYGKATEYMEVSMNSAGTAEQKFEAYLDSLEAKTKSLQASFESLAINTFSTEMFGGIIDATSSIVTFLDKTNLLKGTLVGLTAAGAIKAFTMLTTGITNASIRLNEFNSALKLVKAGNIGENEVQMLAKMTANLSQSQLKAVLSSKALSGEQRIAILTAQGLSKSEAEAALSSMGLATAEGAATTSTFTLSGALKGLWATLMANPLILVATAVAGVVAIFSNMAQAAEESKQKAEENFTALKEQAQSTKETNESVKSLIDQYKALADVSGGVWSEQDASKIETIQQNITDLVGEQAANLDLVNGKIDEEYEKLLNIYAITSKSNYDDAESYYLASKQKFDAGYKMEKDFWGNAEEDDHLAAWYVRRAYEELNGVENTGDDGSNVWWGKQALGDDYSGGGWLGDIPTALNSIKSYEEGYEKLIQWRNLLVEATNQGFGDSTGKAYNTADALTYLNGKIEEFKEVIDEAEAAESAFFSAKGNKEALEYLVDNSIATQDEFTNHIKEFYTSADNKEYAKAYIESLHSFLPSFKIPDDIKRDFIAERDELINEITTSIPAADKASIGEWLDGMDLSRYETFVNWWNENSGTQIENQEAMVEAFDKYVKQTQIAIEGLSATGIEARDSISSIWESTDFADVKQKIVELSNTVDGITPKNIKDLAEESEELAEILELDGMNAEFLANIFQYMATGNDGLALITEDALKLNEALSGMTEAFDSVSDAKNRYDELMSADEKDTNFKSMAEAFEVLNQQFVEGKTNSNAFWAAAEYLFGSEQIALWGDDLDAIYNAMSKNVSIFKDADSAGFGFLDRLYAMSEAGQVLDDAGNVIAEISKLSDGSYDIDIDYENIDKIADSMDLSRDAVLSCLEAISMFGDIDFYDIEEVAKVIEEIGIATEISGEKAVNVDKLIEQLVNLGKSNKEIVDIVEDLEELDNITLISADMEVNDLIGSLETLGMVAKDGTTIEIEYTALTDLMKEIGFTKEQAETLITKLGEVDGIQFTNQLGSGSGGVTDVQGVLDHINTMDFSSAESEVDTVTSAVQGLTDTLNGLNGKSISVTIDVVGSAKQAVSDIKGLLGFAKGTDNAPEGAALVGEEGEELVQSGNRAYLVGTNGAEIVNLKQGDRVYTASETKKIKSSGKRLIGSIPAFNGGGTYGTVSNKKWESLLPESSSSNSSSKKSSSSNSSKSTNDAKDELKVFDWIEVAIERIEQVIDRLKATATSTYKALKTKLGATADEISVVNQELALQKQAYNRYMQEANSVGLSSDLAEKVRTGNIQISEYDEDTQKLIKSYSDWYEKAIECSDAIDELHQNLAELYEDNFDNIQDDFNSRLGLIEHSANQYDTGIELLETKGYLESLDYYIALQDVEKQRIAMLNKELAGLSQAFSDAMNSGEIEKYSESWFEMQDSINGVKEEIAEANVELAEYAKTMREIEWGYFDYTQERISQLTQEADFLIDLMSNSDLHTDKGQLTDEGMATMGLHGQNYNVYMAQASMYAEELAEINAQLANDPYNTELIERREELLALQQESIIAAEDEKQAIVSLVEEGIALELESLQELIDAYNDSLDSAKNLYEYEKKISQQTQNIGNLKKQLSAYENDLSQETRAKVQKLTVELAEANEELEQTEYDKMVRDTREILDSLYLEYEAILNSRLDSVDTLIGDMITAVNDNSGLINETLITTANDVGYTMTTNMQNIWNGATGALDGTISKYGDDFSTKFTAVQSVLNSIQANTAAMVAASDEEAQETVDNTNPETTPSEPTTPPSTPPATQPTTPTTPEKTITVGGKINAKGAKIYDYAGDNTPENQYFRNDPIYTVLAEKNGYLKVRHHKLSSGVTGWFKKSDVKAYKTGGLVDYTGLAKVDGTPGKPELMLNAEDTKNFLELRDVLREMALQELSIGSKTANADYGIDASPRLTGITDISGKLAQLKNNTVSQSHSVTFGDTNINIDHVDDYNDFVTKLRDDKKFEKMLLSMTVDRIVGGSSLEKTKYKWKK